MFTTYKGRQNVTKNMNIEETQPNPAHMSGILWRISKPRQAELRLYGKKYQDKLTV